MHYTKFAVSAASLALFAVARADDFDLDNDDIPSQCRSLCEPVKRLADICETDDDFDERMTDREEDLLQAQCFCTNSSFDVAGRTSECAACMHQNNRDRDDNDDIDDIMWTCGFASASSWNSNAHTTSVNVQATRPTAAADLTTTIDGGRPAQTDDDNSNNNTGGNAQPTSTSDDDSNNSNNNNNNNNNGADASSNDSPSDTPNAAAGTVPMGSMGGFIGFGAYVAAAAVAGGMLLR